MNTKKNWKIAGVTIGIFLLFMLITVSGGVKDEPLPFTENYNHQFAEKNEEMAKNMDAVKLRAMSETEQVDFLISQNKKIIESMGYSFDKTMQYALTEKSPLEINYVISAIMYIHVYREGIKEQKISESDFNNMLERHFSKETIVLLARREQKEQEYMANHTEEKMRLKNKKALDAAWKSVGPTKVFGPTGFKTPSKNILNK